MTGEFNQYGRAALVSKQDDKMCPREQRLAVCGKGQGQGGWSPRKGWLRPCLPVRKLRRRILMRSAICWRVSWAMYSFPGASGRLGELNSAGLLQDTFGTGSLVPGAADIPHV